MPVDNPFILSANEIGNLYGPKECLQGKQRWWFKERYKEI